MANYANLISDIHDAIKTNGTGAISGQATQTVLDAMVASLGSGFQYKGIATPSTDPGTPDENVFYIASTAGTYTNFGGLVLADGEIAILKYNGTWTKDVLGAEPSLSKALLPDGDINDVDSNGIWFLNGTYQNTPEGITQGFLRVSNPRVATKWLIQECWNLGGTKYFVRRRNYGDDFSAWRRIVDTTDLDNIEKELGADIEKIDIRTSELLPQVPTTIVDGKFLKTDGTEGVNAAFAYAKYELESYVPSCVFTMSYVNAALNALIYFDDENTCIGYSESKGNSGRTVFVDQPELIPEGTKYICLNIQKSQGYGNIKLKGEPILSQNLKDNVDALNKRFSGTKIVISTLESPVSSVFGNRDETTKFYIRAKYNSQKDIIVTHYYNGNGLVSFLAAYIGANTLSDADLMTSTYLISEHHDSTAPFFKVTEYWHLFAQHGYPIPHVSNPGLTSSDVGAVWKDQLDREYTVGRVTDSLIYLLPTIYQSGGHDVRDWKAQAWSTAITSLTHVSGGTYTSPITVSGYGEDQLRPIMSVSGRKFILDGVEITAPGTYYGNEFQVSESAIGYDPASIDNDEWFANTGDNVDTSGASPMAKFTFSYNYCGAQCCVNTTVQVVKALQCERYGAIQQQFFWDKGDYKAMFMIPKAAAQHPGGVTVELDKPFNSPNAQAWSPDIHRNAAQLKDVDNPVDRQIGFLFDPNTGNYLAGMAAGLSLVSGDTVTSKRIQNCEVGDDQYHTLLGFSAANINKMYIAAINTGKYQDHFFPVGLFKEINYYVSYFDPAENVGQVYWYKDGSRYVIYCHCQTQQTALAVNVPECMEGLSLSVVEKTADTELLTDTIQNGKFFVNYNTTNANYIVLVAE